MRHLSYLKVLREPVYTKLTMVKDIDEGEYYVEKSLIVNIDIQKQLFENEVRIHSQLDHRYIVKFVELLEQYRFLIEYAPKGNLQHIIDSDADQKLRIKLSLNFLRGLMYLHESGYVHNDIKPSNILINNDNRAKLADFAFTGKIGEVTFQQVPASFVLGTASFKLHDEKTRYINLISNDIYAVGIVLLHLFSTKEARNKSDPRSIQEPIIREIVRNCLNGHFKEIGPICDALSNM